MKGESFKIAILITIFIWFIYGGLCYAIAGFNGMLVGGIFFLSAWIAGETLVKYKQGEIY